MNHRFLGVLSACAFVLVGACESTDPSPSGTGNGVSAVQFQDVVVPDGMVIHEDFAESHSREEPGWRYGHFVYSGDLSIEEASTFVLRRMPQHAWTLVTDDKNVEDARRLKFSRGRSTVEYALERQEGVTHMVIDYRTQIPPR